MIDLPIWGYILYTLIIGVIWYICGYSIGKARGLRKR